MLRSAAFVASTLAWSCAAKAPAPTVSVSPVPAAPAASASPSSSPAASASASPASLLEPATPARMKEILSTPGSSATVVNVWATWCEPCVKEFPDVVRAGRAVRSRGVRTVLVSADFEGQRAAAEAFLQSQGVDFVTYAKIGDDQAFIEALSASWSGSIPVTMIFDAQGKLRFFREGEIDYAGLIAAIDAVLE